MSIISNGRKKILTNLFPNGNIEHDKEIIPLILDESYAIHSDNITEINYLYKYYYNDTDIQQKTKTTRADINNKISIPQCMKTVLTINSYCFSSPFKYVAREAEQVEKVKFFNDALVADSSHSKFAEATLASGICGLGYRYVSKPSLSDIENGMYFHTNCDINPANAYCVYSNDILKEKVLGVFYCDERRISNKNGIQTISIVRVFNVFTKWHRWIFENELGTAFYSNIKFPTRLIINNSVVLQELEALPYKLSDNGLPMERTIPLIEYVRKPDRTSDFELAILLSNAIDTIISNSADCIAQNVDYIFKFKDIDIGEWDENNQNPTLEKIKKAIAEHILSVNSNPESNNPPDIDILEVPLNQSDVVSLINKLYSMLQEITFIPNRNSSNGGADTNSSVETRNGFRSLEDIAGIITSSILLGEKDFIKCALEIANDIDGCPFSGLKAKEIEIKPMRNKVESIINQTQAFATMINAGVNRVTAYVVSGLVADPTDTAKMDELERNKLFQETLKQELEKIAKTNEVLNADNNSAKDKVDEPKTE